MNQQRRSFYRKIAYACAIAVLLLPIARLSAPATTKGDGGKLATLRKQYEISQANIGEIDPASETIKLATLGMRGVAANILWEKANYYKMREDWTSFSAALEQITKLQPNFLAVWAFQGWNLAYNVSTEFDNYRDRYFWVIKGINFLKEGVTYNRDNPRLYWEIGWTLGNKIGRADERVQYRAMFVDDDDFHNADLPNGPNRRRAERDNWLVSQEKFLKVLELVDTRGFQLKGKSPNIYRSDPAMAQINYSQGLEEDGIFGERAKLAWAKAEKDWRTYGDHEVPTSWGINIQLNARERYEEAARKAEQELNGLAPAKVRETLLQRKIAALPEDLRKARDIPAEQRTPEQQSLADSAKAKLEVTDIDVAEAVDAAKRPQALRAAEKLAEARQMVDIIDRYRDIVNFNYWVIATRLGHDSDGLAAREAIYKAERAFHRAQLDDARKLYDQGFASWRKVIDKEPKLLKFDLVVEDMADMMDTFRKLLDQLDEQFPKPFVLDDVLRRIEDVRPRPQAAPGTAPPRKETTAAVK